MAMMPRPDHVGETSDVFRRCFRADAVAQMGGELPVTFDPNPPARARAEIQTALTAALE